MADQENDMAILWRSAMRLAVCCLPILCSTEPLFAQNSLPVAPAQSSQSSQGQQEQRLPWVKLDGNYFSIDGKRFIPVGVHWVPANAALQWPVQWDPKSIEADFSKMHELGYNTVRLDLMWAWFEPRPGDYNAEAFHQLDSLIALAHQYKLYLHPSLFIGGEVGEAYWDVPWRHGRNPQSDPEMLRLETNLAGEFARRYANESAILAWDLTDEPPFWISGGATDAMAINWTRLIGGAIRKYDRNHPMVVGTSMQDVDHGPFRPDTIAQEVDFLSVHPYTIYARNLFQDPMLSERGTYGAAYETALSGSAGRPVMVQELGASSAQYTPERIALYERANLYSSLGAGANGFLLWCFTDAAPEQFHKVPYLRSPHETQFGMVTWDRKDRPQAGEFKKFEDVVAQMDLSGISPAPADAAILVPDEWAKPHGDFSHLGLTGPEVIPYTSVFDGDAMPGGGQPGNGDANAELQGAWLSAFILARRAGITADFPREYSEWSSRPMLILPSPLTSSSNPIVHVHSDFWDKARQYVANGGALYASLSSDAAIPEMETLFGARIEDSVVPSELTLKVVAPLGGLNVGDTFHYIAPAGKWGVLLALRGAEVIAVDQLGRPALVAHSYGKGKVLLSAYPLESYLASTPAAFDQPEATHRIYQALRNWAGHAALFQSDNPSVEVSTLAGDRHGYVVLTNHSALPQTINLKAAPVVHSMYVVRPDKKDAVAHDGANWKLQIEAYGGMVLDWK
jgi:endo-1,4-beta-mannosidase